MTFKHHAGYGEAPTKAEERQIMELSAKLAAVVPDKTDPKVVLGAVAHLCFVAFSTYIKPDDIVKTFEDFGFFTRRALVDHVKLRKSQGPKQ